MVVFVIFVLFLDYLGLIIVLLILFLGLLVGVLLGSMLLLLVRGKGDGVIFLLRVFVWFGEGLVDYVICFVVRFMCCIRVFLLFLYLLVLFNCRDVFLVGRLFCLRLFWGMFDCFCLGRLFLLFWLLILLVMLFFLLLLF